jgi:hypothetical protein
MFKNLFYKFKVFGTPEENLRREEKIFPNIVGYSDINKLLLKSLISKDPVNILLTGPPSSSKTIFLLEIPLLRIIADSKLD